LRVAAGIGSVWGKLRSLGALYRETAVAHLDKADGCDVVALERAVR
jgi:hypothetical protein